MEKQNACFARATEVWLAVNQSITTPVSVLANKFDVRNILHGQVILAAVDQINVFHEAMKGCKNIKIH